MADREGWQDGEPVPLRPDPSFDAEGQRERTQRMLDRRAARARTLQLVEWLGFAGIVLGVALLAPLGWAVIAAGVALIVVANAS